MVIHLHAPEVNFEIVILVQNFDPPEFLILFSFADMSCLIIAAHLHITSILTEAHSELALLDNLLLEHDIVDWLKPVKIHSWTL